MNSIPEKKLIVKDDVKINIDGKEYSYFMTNNARVFIEKLKEFNITVFSFDDFFETQNISPTVINTMKSIGAIFSLTTSNGANEVIKLTEDKTYILYLDKLQKKYKIPNEYEDGEEEEEEKLLWANIANAFSNIYRKRKHYTDPNFDKNQRFAMFCIELVKEDPIAEYYLYFELFLHQKAIFFQYLPFSNLLDGHISRFIKQGGKLSDIYKKTGMNKQTFSRIRSGQIEKPSIDSIVQLSIGLRLPSIQLLTLADSANSLTELIARTGDVVLTAFSKGNYDINSINEELFKQGFQPIGFNDKS